MAFPMQTWLAYCLFNHWSPDTFVHMVTFTAMRQPFHIIKCLKVHRCGDVMVGNYEHINISKY